MTRPSPEPTEEVLSTLSRALRGTARPGRRDRPFELLAATQELSAWLTDARQAGRARPENWTSLLRDVELALDQCGPRLLEHLSVGVSLGTEVAEVRAVVKARGEAPDAALKRRLAVVVSEITRRSRTGGARVAALDDALDAAATGFAEALAACDQLVALANGAGYDEPSLAQGVAARIDGTRKAEPTIEQRVDDGRTAVRRSAPVREVVVWLRIDYAPLGWPPILRIGPHVRVFDERWFAEVVRAEGDHLDEDAPEVRSYPDHVERLAPEEPRGTPDGDEPQPAAIVRVAFTEETVVRGRERALQTVEALSGLACLYGADPGTWIVADDYCSYVDGEPHGMRIAASGDRRVPAFPSLVVGRDQAADALREIASDLGRNLPIADDEIAHAGELLHWLRQARLSSAPPRLILYDRVLEQVSGWAGVDAVRRFVQDYLRGEWAYGQMHRHIVHAARVAHAILIRQPSARSLLEEYCDQPASLSSVMRLRPFVEIAPRVHAAVEGVDSYERDDNLIGVARLKHIADASGSKDVRKKWLQTLLEDFDRLERRRRRTRNGLVHGGPLTARTVESVVGFAEQLAFNALGASIEGRLLKRRDLIDHFLAERGRYELFVRQIRQGEGLAESLFGSDP